MAVRTELDKLKARLLDYEKRGHIHLHVAWGPRAHLATAEERAAELNRAIDAVKAGDYDEMPPIGDSVRAAKSDLESK